MRGLAVRMRRWRRRHRVGLQSAAAMLALATLVSLPSAVIWDVMAGERITIAQQSARATPDPSVPQANTPGRPNASHRPDLHPSAPAAQAHSTTSAAPATTVSGTAIAIGLIVLLTTLALFVARTMLLRCQGVAVAERDEADTVNTLTDHGSVEPNQNAEPNQGDESNQETGPNGVAEPAGVSDAAGVSEAAGIAETGVQSLSAAVDPTAEPLPIPPPPATLATATNKPPLKHPTRRAASDRASSDGPVILYDRRLAQRVAYQSKARLQWDAHDLACISEDISMRGVRLRLPCEPPAAPPPPAGTTVRVTLTLDGALTTLKARVGWQRSDETSPLLGLQFLGVQSRHETLLQPIVLRGTPI